MSMDRTFRNGTFESRTSKDESDDGSSAGRAAASPARATATRGQQERGQEGDRRRGAREDAQRGELEAHGRQRRGTCRALHRGRRAQAQEENPHWRHQDARPVPLQEQGALQVEEEKKCNNIISTRARRNSIRDAESKHKRYSEKSCCCSVGRGLTRPPPILYTITCNIGTSSTRERERDYMLLYVFRDEETKPAVDADGETKDVEANNTGAKEATSFADRGRNLLQSIKVPTALTNVLSKRKKVRHLTFFFTL
ncbi:unnamed protein product [Trichogramma brassicae]|uniref:Uncharacterized protein n=1 Tax=Trichogramma brassicae TaxID=86971 RepID=A0A6H5IPV2_9HYME|nr:unnamed protein product [Trichogramma brassicae]